MRKFYQAKNLKRFPELGHAFTTTYYGNLSWQSAKSREVWEETARAQVDLASDLGFDPNFLVSCFQTHSKKVTAVGSARSKITIFPSDGLVTDQKGYALMVHTADCLPVLIYDPVNHAVAAVHVGWRGLLKGICSEAVLSLEKKYNSLSQDLVVAIGPSIGPCHFEVKDDVLSQFKEKFSNRGIFMDSDARHFLDMGNATTEALIETGIYEKNIEILPFCTYCRTEFSSYRRDKKIVRSMGSIIFLK